MDFDNAKENIQPLAQGRNASILHASLQVESNQELLSQRKALEEEINNYCGDDPLSAWYCYIEWIEQSFPSGGKESGLQEVLCKCLGHFESDERYKQDRRMVKLYIKFIDTHKDPAECYKQLYNAGIGTMVADFYIAWAYFYDLIGNTRMADEIFHRGIICRAQPLEELQEARQHFGFTVAQRFMYKEDDPIREETNRQLQERRMALTSLRGHRRKQNVGSIRTGSAIKSLSPGKLKIELPTTSSQRGNIKVSVFSDENENPNAILTAPSNNSISANESGKSVVRSIIDAAIDQENQKEPGPWDKAHKSKNTKLFACVAKRSELSFEIHEDAYDNVKKLCTPPILIADNDIRFNKAFIFPPNFCSKSKPIKGWVTPVTTEEIPDANTLPRYCKYKMYPRANMEFQPEELKAYNILKKRCVENDFIKDRDVYWGNGLKYGIRLYPNFATASKPQNIDSLDLSYIPEKLSGLEVVFEEIYNKEEKTERQFEEILALRVKRNKTIIETVDMEETVCVSDKIRRRKSFFPLRKSLCPSTLSYMHKIPEQREIYHKLETNSDLSSSPPCTKVGKEFEAKLDNENVKFQKLVTTNGVLSSTPCTKVFEELEEKTGNLNINQIQQTTQSLQLDFKNPPISSVVKTSNTENQPDIITENTVSEVVPSKPFQIYEDDTSVEHDCIKTTLGENDYQFKTPALNTPNTYVSSKAPFEIFNDENVEKKKWNSFPKPDVSYGTAEFFDTEETCSTQTFNIFLKAQSVSTPKVNIKSKPQKYFGNILKEVTQPTKLDLKDELTDNQSGGLDKQNYSPEAILSAGYSPPRQQLSTILETSEHGTTQGTHTTGATTKSTLSSPEFDLDTPVQLTTTTGMNQLPVVLETVSELSCESSAIIINKLNNENTNTNKSQICQAEKSIEIPVSMRFKNEYPKDGLNSSYSCKDSRNKIQIHVGNFSRLEEKEDTATDAVFKTLQPICFQVDKTETIPKMLISSQQYVEDDKTETIPKIMIEPPLKTTFQDDKTETIPKLFVGSSQTIKFLEDKTESEIIEKPISEQKFMSEDHSFEFFGQTPTKQEKRSLAKKWNEARTVENNNITPLTFEPTPFCNNNTHEMKSETNSVLIEDKLQPYFQNQHTSNMKNNVINFSSIEENAPVFAQNKIKTKSKSIFRDSFIPDFSLMEDFEAKKKEVQSEHQDKTINQSILPELSFLKNTQAKSEQSISIKSSSQEMENRYLKGSANQSADKKKTNSGTILNNIHMDAFLNDFTKINEQQYSIPNCVKQLVVEKPLKGNSSLRFLNDSLQQKCAPPKYEPNNFPALDNISISNRTKLNFLEAESAKENACNNEKRIAASNQDKYFELNCETEMFGTNISMIKNSTWLPNHGPSTTENTKQLSQTGKSFHMKSEEILPHSLTSSEIPKGILKSVDGLVVTAATPLHSGDPPICILESPDNEMSIYYKKTPKTPQAQVHIWNDADAFKPSAENTYVHVEHDLNHSTQVIENMFIDPNVNPFDVDLINAFLEQHYVISYLRSLPTCQLVGCVQRLKRNAKININGNNFEVIKLIGEGAYGAVFCGKATSNNKLVAMKQEKPPNCWEYYICLEVQERIKADEMIPAYMSVDYALIGNNSSILISQFSHYGSIISVCNKIKKHTMKNVHEYVVMLLASELLEIIDHLHAVNIIHADIKADNFLLMNKLTYPPTKRHLQLIDFGVSIDMKLFKKGQTFCFVNKENSFKCPEMREKRPWTYQLDLYGLAGVIHVLLFGKYMDIEKKTRSFWMHKTAVPRYLNKHLWDEIFKTLLNVRDCNSMPNLQELRALLKKEMEEKDKYVLKMVNEFNQCLNI